ncbi:MAG: cyclic nucleotide-binding domain-containing protein [Anaerolineales bacterium]|nr:cyclic nucleotide-binding domain-containing protein [Anaerolineales bacterium]
MLDSLPQLPLFHGLGPAQIALLKPLFESFFCETGTVIFEQGNSAQYLYLLLKGEVVIQYKPYDGPEIILTRLRAGDAFGWSAVVGSPMYTSSITSASEIEAIRIRGNQLWKMVEEHPETGRIIIDRLARIVSPRWENAHMQIQSFLNSSQTESIGEKNMTTTESTPIDDPLRHLIENLNAYIEQYHGGTVEFISFDGHILAVKLGGACLNCPLLPSTLHGWVAGTVRQFFPNVEVVEAK